MQSNCQLDSAQAAIDALPHIVAAVPSAFPVLVDGGFRRGVDVLKALALGAEGIDVTDGEDALVADEAPAFAAAVLRLLREPALRERLRVNGHRQALTAYNWEIRYREWNRVYAEVLSR